MSEKRTLNPADAEQAELPAWLQRDRRGSPPRAARAAGPAAPLDLRRHGDAVGDGAADCDRLCALPAQPVHTRERPRAQVHRHQSSTMKGWRTGARSCAWPISRARWSCSISGRATACRARMKRRCWNACGASTPDQNVVFVGINTDDIESDARAYMDEIQGDLSERARHGRPHRRSVPHHRHSRDVYRQSQRRNHPPLYLRGE